MSNNKQSSVEWLVEQLEKHYVKTDLKNTVVYQQAKSMHKGEIIKCYNESWHLRDKPYRTAEKYYNETFKNNL